MNHANDSGASLSGFMRAIRGDMRRRLRIHQGQIILIITSMLHMIIISIRIAAIVVVIALACLGNIIALAVPLGIIQTIVVVVVITSLSRLLLLVAAAALLANDGVTCGSGLMRTVVDDVCGRLVTDNDEVCMY